jgi:hypothetical protein
MIGSILFYGFWALVASNLSILDNGVIRVGVDLSQGGVITYLSKSGDSRNIVNDWEPGRQIGQSYYSGPDPYGGAPWPWNPVGSGDGYLDTSQVVASSNDGTTLYVRTVPLQWNVRAESCECFFETWLSLDDNTVHARYRLTNHRADLKRYDAFDQELPAVYTIGTLYRLFTYDGDAPYTGAPAREISPSQGPNWDTFYPTEHWMAFVDDSGWGLGVVNADVTRFLAGFAGVPNTGGPKDDATGYIAPVRQEILDHNITFDHDVALIVGTVDDTRAYAAAHRPADTRPDVQFNRVPFQEDRQHVIYLNATDTGVPLDGALRVRLDQVDPQVWFYDGRFDAASMPVLYLTAAFHTADTEAEIFWAIPGESFDGSRHVRFPIVGDGKFRTYAVDLASVATYTGTVTQLRFDPANGGVPGEFVDIQSITFRSPGNQATRIVKRP